MTTEATQQIEELVEKYRSISPKERREYHEANTKNGFVQPLFEVLGWNFSDLDQVEAEKTIIKGRVDFICKLNGVSQFCLEVKPLRELLTDTDRKQAISYAYHKGVTWAVLTNFDRLQVFNAERETSDLQSVLFLNLTFQDYITSFNDLWLLSRESISHNLLDNQATKYGKLPLRIPIEKRLYRHLRNNREKLFNDIYVMNKERGVTLDMTDALIQELFNRLLFIRTAEDRNLAGNHPLLAALHTWQSNKDALLIDSLRDIFRQFAQLYDSSLFPATFDAWEQIWVDSYLLSDLIKGLFEVPNDFARYDFSIIDADVVGQVYEQYLGYVAQVTKEQQKKQQLRLELGFPATEVIRVEEKRKKRKAEGIYYTPKWVTDYIVRHTLGSLIQEGNTEDVINVRILDPACGSGSFLIRAYDELLAYHAKLEDKPVAELSWSKRRQILEKNIFGVDLDFRAHEIAKLSLLLRALATRDLLPSLDNNILCGNSLISGSDKELGRYFGEKWRDKKPLNWNDRFPQIVSEGGFDIVIGNPPYVNEARGNKDLFRELKTLPKLNEYYEKNMDLFNYFIEIGLDLLTDGGYLAFIIPAYWQDRTGATLLRNKILAETEIKHLVNLKEFKVFIGAQGQHNNIIILKKTTATKSRILTYVEVTETINEKGKDIPTFEEPRQESYGLVNNKFVVGEDTLRLVESLREQDVFYI